MENSEIIFLKKPDWISWDAVQECQAKAHKKNLSHGLKMHCSELTGEELASSLKNGICYVALDGNKVVGTTSLIIEEKRFLWYKRKRLGYLGMEGILPEYQGTEVFLGLQDIRMQDIKKEKIEILYFDTAESNMLVRKLQSRLGFKPCYYISFKSTDYYSVTMAKWIVGKSIPDFLLNLFFRLSERYVKLRYKPHRIKRFGL